MAPTSSRNVISTIPSSMPMPPVVGTSSTTSTVCSTCLTLRAMFGSSGCCVRSVGLGRGAVADLYRGLGLLHVRPAERRAVGRLGPAGLALVGRAVVDREAVARLHFGVGRVLRDADGDQPAVHVADRAR